MKLRNIIWWTFLVVVFAVCYFATRSFPHPYATQYMLILSGIIIWLSLWLSSMAQDAYLRNKAFMLDPNELLPEAGIYFAQFAGMYSKELPMLCMWKAEVNSESMVASWDSGNMYRYVFRPANLSRELLEACKSKDHSRAKSLSEGCFLVFQSGEFPELSFHPTSDQITWEDKHEQSHPRIDSAIPLPAES
ncbi:MAG TPA: hypothetical protein VJH63_03005 [Candidatus Paceibacterota bacterium]